MRARHGDDGLRNLRQALRRGYQGKRQGNKLKKEIFTVIFIEDREETK